MDKSDEQFQAFLAKLPPVAQLKLSESLLATMVKAAFYAGIEAGMQQAHDIFNSK